MNIAFVPVRGGSRSIPKKNIKDFCGKPLVFWVLDALEHAQHIDLVYVSTDSDEIITVVESFKFSKVRIFRRSDTNAQDTSSTESAMLELIEQEKLNDTDNFVLVQATSPFTRSADFDTAIEKYNKEDSDSLLTCVRSKRYYWDDDGQPLNYDYNDRPRRQDFLGTFMENGAFYISQVRRIKNSGNRISGNIAIHEMDHFTALELDEPHDWNIAENVMYEHVLLPNIKNDIKIFLSDVDGTLTDGGMHYDEKGNETKRFNTHDGKGFELLRKAGIKTGFLTGENSPMVKARAKKIQVDYFHGGVTGDEKLEIANQICQDEGVSLNEVAYIGDDINCIPLLESVGLAACPDNAHMQVKQIPGIIRIHKKGGDGAVRDFIDRILK